MRLSAISAALLFGFSFAAACAPATEPPESEDLAEDATATGEGVSGTLAQGTQLKATGNVNLRSSASGSAKILHVVPSGSTVTLVSGTPTNGYYNVKHDGTVGWSYGAYYEPVPTSGGAQPAGATLVANADVNLRSGPSTSYSILSVVTSGSQVTLVSPNAVDGFYNINFAGTVGYSSSKYFSAASGGSNPNPAPTPTPDPTGDPKITAAMTRAQAGVGFSYWWGHGRFRAEGPNGNAGSCSGSCPNCSHSGSYGADCSGFVAKVWQVPSNNTDLTSDAHPYSTADFADDTSQWSTVSRGNAKKADAFVYRSGSSGHIFLYSSGDGWGSMYAYECKGCSAGCIKGYRTATSAYHAIRRAGY